MKNKIDGFTLIELMIVVAIIAVLSVLAVPGLMKSLAKAKRAEAYINLGSLAMAEKAYFAEHGAYSANLGDIGWKPEGSYNYTYGFNGSEGKNNFIGGLKTPSAELKGAGVTPDGFVAVAAGDVDGDGTADVISIDQNNTITIVQDDLK